MLLELAGARREPLALVHQQLELLSAGDDGLDVLPHESSRLVQLLLHLAELVHRLATAGGGGRRGASEGAEGGPPPAYIGQVWSSRLTGMGKFERGRGGLPLR